MSLPGDPGLPPGCSERHIELRMGADAYACPECDGTGEINVSACCDVPLHGEYQDDLICPKCNQGCERPECDECGGSGEVPAI